MTLQMSMITVELDLWRIYGAINRTISSSADCRYWKIWTIEVPLAPTIKQAMEQACSCKFRISIFAKCSA